MKIRRDVNSIPARTAADTWKTIVELIAGPDTQHRADLEAVAGVMGSLIADECPAKEPFILSGVGPRLVLYCAYGSNALTGDENIDSLSWNPTAGDWQLKVPCDHVNLAWVNKSLAKKSARVTAYDVEKPEVGDTGEAGKGYENKIKIDWRAGGTT